VALKEYLEKHYESLRGGISGGNHPPSWAASTLVTAAYAAQIGGVALLFMGAQIFAALGMAQPPGWYNDMRENQMQVFLGLFLVSSLAQNMAATGAFEISLNGQLLFSKIQSGRMPTIEEIEALLAKNGVVKSSGARHQQQFADRKF
jgi:selT/selW/selH-like putative selenoprotein